MNDSTRVMRRPRRAWPPTARTVAAIIATAALALLAAACSSGPSSTGSGGSPNAGGSASSPSAVSYSHCMRSHGVPNWPDPTPYPPYPNDPTFMLPASIQPIPQTISKMDVCLRLVPNNEVVGHIDNDNWQAAQQAMAGQ
jgi:hypothetical protein